MVQERIRCLVPVLPDRFAIAKYLAWIDAHYWGSNFGGCVQELERRLSEKYNGAHVVTVASCTAGLELVWERLKRLGDEDRVTMPAFTFPASVLAPARMGFEIDFCDVDKHTWTAPPVAGFGLPEIGSPLDAAAAFGEQEVGRYQTAVFSLHSTKIVGAGEGGYIVTHDAREAEEYRRMSNFGIENYVSRGPGTNAKLSEYHAAVGLAALDAYRREPWLELFDDYKRLLPRSVKQQRRPRGVYPILSVKLPCPVEPVREYLKARGIETRRWYYPCMAEHPNFLVENWREELPVTADLCDHLIGLPWHLHLSQDDVARVCEELAAALEHVRDGLGVPL